MGGGGIELVVYALPFIKRSKRCVILEHRPNQENAVSSDVLCNSLGLKFIKCNSDKDIDNECDLYLIAGSRILSNECIKKKLIINCHPGIIPAVRGLDSLKWAILNMQPVGNTLHYINENVDLGRVISVVKTPLFETDSLETFARRHYEREIYILSRFYFYIQNPINDFLNVDSQKPNKRMDISTEAKMCRIFDEYKNKYALNKIYS